LDFTLLLLGGRTRSGNGHRKWNRASSCDGRILHLVEAGVGVTFTCPYTMSTLYGIPTELNQSINQSIKKVKMKATWVTENNEGS